MPLRQVVRHRALVEHAEDHTVLRGAAERVVLRLVREAPRLEDADGQLLLRVVLLHDVETAAVRAVQGAHRRVRSHARVAGGAGDVARAFCRNSRGGDEDGIHRGRRTRILLAPRVV